MTIKASAVTETGATDSIIHTITISREALGQITATASDSNVMMQVDDFTPKAGDVYEFTLTKGTLKDTAGLGLLGVTTNVITFSSLPAGMTYTVANTSGKLVVTFNHVANEAIAANVAMNAVIKAAAVTEVGALDSEDIAVTLQKNVPVSPDGYYEYDLNGTNVTITRYLKSDTDITISSSLVPGKTVAAIGTGVFMNKNLTSVILPNTITNIGSSAFNGNNLTSITIPNNVTIDSYAFISNNLNTITIGTGVSLGNNVFTGDNNNYFRQAYTSGQGGAGTYVGTQNGTWTKVVPTATVGNVVVNGTASSAITSKEVVITLTNVSLKNSIAAGANLATWITNLPSGLTAVAKSTIAAGATSVTITIAGTPTAVYYACMTIFIPAASLTSNANLIATTNLNAYFQIVGHYLGENYGGGKIVYLLQPSDTGYDSNVQHGLIAATVILKDPDNIAVDNYGGVDGGYFWALLDKAETVLSSTSSVIGSGSGNTTAIINQNGSGESYGYTYAAEVASNYSINGYDDWYLPSYGELVIMYTNRDYVGGAFAGHMYWSSTEDGDAFAKAYGVYGNSSLSKNLGFLVWPVRSF